MVGLMATLAFQPTRIDLCKQRTKVNDSNGMGAVNDESSIHRRLVVDESLMNRRRIVVVVGPSMPL